MFYVGFGASRYNIEGLDSKPLVLHKPCPFVWGLEGVGKTPETPKN